jgi:hypothetical protein
MPPSDLVTPPGRAAAPPRRSGVLRAIALVLSALMLLVALAGIRNVSQNVRDLRTMAQVAMTALQLAYSLGAPVMLLAAWRGWPRRRGVVGAWVATVTLASALVPAAWVDDHGGLVQALQFALGGGVPAAIAGLLLLVGTRAPAAAPARDEAR